MCSPIQDFFHQRIAARNHVADHIQIRIQVGLLRAETDDQLDTLGFELGAHRGIDILVAAGDTMAGALCQYCQAAHEGAADTEDVDMHCRISKLGSVILT